MLIHCTKKLLDELKIAPSASSENIDPLFSWRAHIITINRRKTVVLMCDLNRYVVVLYGLKAKDFKEIDKRITVAIRNTLLKAQVNPDVIERYLADADQLVFAKNSDRTQTARLNKACEAVQFFDNDLEEGCSDTIGVKASNYLVGDGNGDYFYPNEKMMMDLKQLGIEPIYKCRAIELTVRLELADNDAIRRLIVPIDMTFTQFHKVLQAAFEWQDDHLFDFWLIEQEGKNKASVELVMNEEDLTYRNGNVRLMEGINLSEYLPQYKYLLYHYDFGDGWRHHIEVNNVIEDYTESLPLFIAGKGNAPPEDVGGVGGYEEFLKVMNNPAHEDYSHFSVWGRSQGYSEFDSDKISRRVEKALLW